MKAQKQLQKTNNKLFVMSIQDENGHILKVLYNTSYDQLWLLGTVEAKAMRGYWTIHRFPDGQFIDGNYRSAVANNK